MDKTIVIVLIVLGLAVLSFYAYGKYKQKRFDTDCLSRGGTILESGHVCG